MNFLVFGASMALVAFLIVNVLVSAAVIAVAPRLTTRLGSLSPQTRSSALLTLRFLPVLAAGAVAGGLVMPAYLLLEPANAGERLSPTLVALCLLTFALVLGGLGRGLRAHGATSALVGRWRRSRERVLLPDSSVPAYRVRDAFPAFAVVGIFRPRIYVSAQVLDALTPSELAAGCAHEVAHLVGGDNLKRLLMRSCPDALALLATSRELEREWARAAEAAADDRAARGGEGVALALAGGLVKVARLAPARVDALPMSALHDGSDVDERVRRLVAMEDGATRAAEPRAWLPFLAAVPLAAALLVAYGLPAVHQLIETVARLLD
ncbi:MAG TPA: M48 family metalloprotease [Vicinamibacteria bacterium]|nr:M48 family metalloprotease [Vicinamibacteria bacterium]